MISCLKYIPLVILLTITNKYTASSQKTNKADSISGTRYIESYTDKLGVYAYGISKFSNFELKESGQKNDSVLRYSPNGNFNVGLGFNYKWLGIGAAFNFGAINNDEDLKGKTKNIDLQLDIYAKRMIFNANLQSYNGYYWKNPEIFFPDWNTKDSLLIRPDISTVTFGLKGIYIFNHKKFSVKAAYQFTERQLKSSGSMLLGSRFSLYGISADSSIVPSQLYDFYPNARDVGGLSSLSLGASFGYTHTFIIGKYFFVNTLLMTGLNWQFLTVRNVEKEEIGSDGKPSINITARLALGVNKPKAFYGMNFIFDSFFLRNPNNTNLSYSYGKFRIYYGRRFNLGKG